MLINYYEKTKIICIIYYNSSFVSSSSSSSSSFSFSSSSSSLVWSSIAFSLPVVSVLAVAPTTQCCSVPPSRSTHDGGKPKPARSRPDTQVGAGRRRTTNALWCSAVGMHTRTVRSRARVIQVTTRTRNAMDAAIDTFCRPHTISPSGTHPPTHQRRGAIPKE